MPKRVKELSALEVGRIKADGVHAVGGVSGLALQVFGPSRAWILRYTHDDKRRTMGLGAHPEVGIGEARIKAAAARDLVRQGIDPIEARNAARVSTKSAAAAEVAAAVTFAEVAKAYIRTHRREWKNAKHVEQWTSTLETYAYPVIGDMIVRDIDTPHILAILQPIWETKTETAVRLRGRLEKILGANSELRPGKLNPARWADHLEHKLAKPGKIAQREHHASIDYREMPAFMTRLRSVEGESAAALRFAILTAARSGEVRGATAQEVDWKAATWTIPGTRMKAGNPHRVPLSPAAVEMLRGRERGDLLFPSSRTGLALSDMAMTAVARRMGVDAVPHGLARATFKTWATEQTAYPREVIEAALAHTLENKTEDAYWRGDLMDKRRRLMAEWASYCMSTPAEASVTPIRKERAGR